VSTRARLAFVGLPLALFAMSLALPALGFQIVGGALETERGWEALFTGWCALFVGNLGWLANVVYVPGLGVLAAGAHRVALGFGTVAALLALHSLRLLGVDLPADEGGVRHMILTGLGPGFYVWLAAILFLPLVAARGAWRRVPVDPAPLSR
jgi:hypothetical protein